MSVVLFIIVVTRKGKEMAEYVSRYGAWIETDGSYGVSQVVMFDVDALDEDQWELLDSLNDGAKFDFVYAVLNNENLSEWEDR
jgi:hypothetical protein